MRPFIPAICVRFPIEPRAPERTMSWTEPFGSSAASTRFSTSVLAPCQISITMRRFSSRERRPSRKSVSIFATFSRAAATTGSLPSGTDTSSSDHEIPERVAYSKPKRLILFTISGMRSRPYFTVESLMMRESTFLEIGSFTNG